MRLFRASAVLGVSLFGCACSSPTPSPTSNAGGTNAAAAAGQASVASAAGTLPIGEGGGTASASTAEPQPAVAGSAGSAPLPIGLPDPILILNPSPTKTYVVVTAGQSNAGLRIDDGGLAAGWNHPLDTLQNPLIEKTLGALAVHDSGDRYGGELNSAVGGCGLVSSMDDCHFVDDMTSSDPASWVLHGWGTNLAANLNANKQRGDLVFISWIQGEANAHSLNADPAALPGSTEQGGPYPLKTKQEWANHYKQALERFIVLLREASGLPQLRMGIQLIASYDGLPDLIRQAQLDAIAESDGALVLENGNPWQWYQPISAQDGAHYSGQAYADFCLETGRSIAYALKCAGNVDSAAGPGYGRFPAITGTHVSGSHIDVEVSNPNAASTLLLPPQNRARGWGVTDQGQALIVTDVSLAGPFTLRLTVSGNPSASARVSYGTEDNHAAAGEAVTDDAALASPADSAPVERRNMPLSIKPF
jgi:hypothetical protein